MPRSRRMLQDHHDGVVAFTPRRFLRSGPNLAGIQFCWDSICFQKPDDSLTRLGQQNANQRHVHSIKTKYCGDTRPGQQLEAAQRQHADLCYNVSGTAVTFHTILLGVKEVSPAADPPEFWTVGCPLVNLQGFLQVVNQTRPKMLNLQNLDLENF
eukprot:1156653-Pelagomonas_calceolata.AAC.4